MARKDGARVILCNNYREPPRVAPYCYAIDNADKQCGPDTAARCLPYRREVVATSVRRDWGRNLRRQEGHRDGNMLPHHPSAEIKGRGDWAGAMAELANH